MNGQVKMLEESGFVQNANLLTGIDPEKIRAIPLTQGLVAIVDVTMYDYLAQWRWHAFNNKYTFYAVRQIRTDKGQRHEWMHRVIMGMARGDRRRVDHKDRDGLHNWGENLRVVTNALNSHNRKLQANNTVGYRGVYWHNNKWEASIRSNGKLIFCGCFTDLVMAATAYDKAAIKIYGENAVLNFPKETL